MVDEEGAPLSDQEERDLLGAEFYKQVVDSSIHGNGIWYLDGRRIDLPAKLLVPCGNTSFSTGVLREISSGDASVALLRHSLGMWKRRGTPDSVAEKNIEALSKGGPLLSLYTTSEGTKFMLYTSPDRAETKFMLLREFMRDRPDRSVQVIQNQKSMGLEIARRQFEQQRQQNASKEGPEPLGQTKEPER